MNQFEIKLFWYILVIFKVNVSRVFHMVKKKQMKLCFSGKATRVTKL